MTEKHLQTIGLLQADSASLRKQLTEAASTEPQRAAATDKQQAADDSITLALAERLQGLLSEVELSREKVRFLEETIQLLSQDLEAKRVRSKFSNKKPTSSQFDINYEMLTMSVLFSILFPVSCCLSGASTAIHS